MGESKYTTENLEQSKQIMDSLGLKSALLVSDPLQMKRTIKLAKYYEIDCKSSPTKNNDVQINLCKSKAAPI